MIFLLHFFLQNYKICEFKVTTSQNEVSTHLWVYGYICACVCVCVCVHLRVCVGDGAIAIRQIMYKTDKKDRELILFGNPAWTYSVQYDLAFIG